MQKKNKPQRSRNFATIVYPESCQENWLETLSEFHVPAFVSPLHDRDVTAAGEPKKAHYHVLFFFDGPKTHEQAMELIDQIGGVGFYVVNVLRAYARYLCHLDDPNKAQYDVSKVLEFSGAVYSDIITSSSDRYLAIQEMMEFCDKYNVSSFYLLSKYAAKERMDWYRILCDSGTVFIREFCKSREWSTGRGIKEIIDPDTGEIII